MDSGGVNNDKPDVCLCHVPNNIFLTMCGNSSRDIPTKPFAFFALTSKSPSRSTPATFPGAARSTPPSKTTSAPCRRRVLNVSKLLTSRTASLLSSAWTTMRKSLTNLKVSNYGGHFTTQCRTNVVFLTTPIRTKRGSTSSHSTEATKTSSLPHTSTSSDTRERIGCED